MPPATVATRHTPPDVVKATPFHSATQSPRVAKSGWMASKIFFFGLSCRSGSPSYPSKVTRSPTAEPSGGVTSSTFPSGPVAANTMAWLCTPRIFDGFMLATHRTRAP